MVMALGLFCTVGILVGCASEGPSSPPAPASVKLLTASITRNGIDDRVMVHLKNVGGSGSFYLDFYGERFVSGSGCKLEPGATTCPHPVQSSVAFSESVEVTAGYEETLQYNIASASVSSVRVATRPVNTALYSVSSCITVRDYGSCP